METAIAEGIMRDNNSPIQANTTRDLHLKAAVGGNNLLFL
jgi:hypothetical protein